MLDGVEPNFDDDENLDDSDEDDSESDSDVVQPVDMGLREREATRTIINDERVFGAKKTRAAYEPKAREYTVS